MISEWAPVGALAVPAPLILLLYLAHTATTLYYIPTSCDGLPPVPKWAYWHFQIVPYPAWCDGQFKPNCSSVSREVPLSSDWSKSLSLFIGLAEQNRTGSRLLHGLTTLRLNTTSSNSLHFWVLWKWPRSPPVKHGIVFRQWTAQASFPYIRMSGSSLCDLINFAQMWQPICLPLTSYVSFSSFIPNYPPHSCFLPSFFLSTAALIFSSDPRQTMFCTKFSHSISWPPVCCWFVTVLGCWVAS